MTPLTDPRELIRHGGTLEPPAVTSENPAERRWYPAVRGPRRRNA
jgi:hypothetical protein